MKKYIALCLFTIHFSMISAQIIGGGGIIKTAGDPNALAVLNVINQRKDGSIAKDTTNGNVYVYDVTASVGSRWKLIANLSQLLWANIANRPTNLSQFTNDLNLGTIYQTLENQRLSTTNSPTFANIKINGGAYHTQFDTERNVYRDVMFYSGNSGTPYTGAFVIETPLMNNAMVNITIKGYNYSEKGAWSANIGGYTYSIPSSSWINYKGEIDGNAPFTSITLGYNTTNNKYVIILGGVTTSWNYPKIEVNEVIVGFSEPHTSYATGWSGSFVTSLSGYGDLRPVNVQKIITGYGQGFYNAAPAKLLGVDGAGYMVETNGFSSYIQGTASYVPLYLSPNSIGNSVIHQNGSNIGIGVTGAVQKLHLYNSGTVGIRLDNAVTDTWDILNSNPTGTLDFIRGGVNHLSINGGGVATFSNNIISNGTGIFAGTVTVANATSNNHAISLGLADGRYGLINGTNTWTGLNYFTNIPIIKDALNLKSSNAFSKYMSFQDAANSEAGWFGYGSTTNNDFYFANAVGNYRFISISTEAFRIGSTENKSLVPLSMSSFKISDLANGTAASDAVNKSQLDNAVTQVSNQIGNFGQLDTNGTFTDFNTVSKLGASFIQGNSNAPSWMGAPNNQGYQTLYSLGSQYDALGSTASSYSMQTVIGRGSVTPYMGVRWKESGVYSEWAKIWAGKADQFTTARNINGTSFDGSVDISTTEYLHSLRNFVNGTLITTNIDYSGTNGHAFLLEIKGNSYGNIRPLDVKVQGYLYDNTIINVGGVSNGQGISGLVALNSGGNLCFWFPNQGYWQGYAANCMAVTEAGRNVNRVTSITDVVKPVGATKEVAITANVAQALHSVNYNSYAPTLTGSGASGTWGINISGSAPWSNITGKPLLLIPTTGDGSNNSNTYLNVRVLQNVNTSASNDGMYIGYANSNSGITRIFGGGATTGGIQVAGSGVSDVSIAGQTVLNLGNYASTLNSVYLGINATASNAGALNGQNGLYYRNATNINTGTLADAQLSTNVPLKNADNAFTSRMSIGGAIDNTVMLNVVGGGKLSTTLEVGTSITTGLLNLTNLAISTNNTNVLSIDGGGVVKSQDAKDLLVAAYQPMNLAPQTVDVGGGVFRHVLVLDCANFYKKCFKVYMNQNTVVDGTQISFTNMKSGGEYTVVYYGNSNRPLNYDSSAKQEDGSTNFSPIVQTGAFTHRFISNGTVAIKAF